MCSSDSPIQVNPPGLKTFSCCVELPQLGAAAASGERPLFDEHDDDDDYDYRFGAGGKDGLRVVLSAPERQPGIASAKSKAPHATDGSHGEAAAGAESGANLDPDGVEPSPVLLGGWKASTGIGPAGSGGETGKERRPSGTEVCTSISWGGTRVLFKLLGFMLIYLDVMKMPGACVKMSEFSCVGHGWYLPHAAMKSSHRRIELTRYILS